MCYVLLYVIYVHSSVAIILMGKRELIALLNLSSWCLVMVEWPFLVVPRGCLWFVIVVFPDHTHLLFLNDPNGHIIRCDLEKADLLNAFFALVFVSKPPGKLPVFDVRYQSTPGTDMEVLTKQLKMNTSKYMGPDRCHPRVLSETVDIVNIPLQKIVDKTFEEGCVPGLGLNEIYVWFLLHTNKI